MSEFDVNELRLLASFKRKPIEVNPENYGGERRFKREEAMRVECDRVEYLVGSTDAWTAGRGRIKVDRAYRIFGRDLEGYTAREILDQEELVNVGIGIVNKIDATLKRREGDKQ
jgi:hypothetical protein